MKVKFERKKIIEEDDGREIEILHYSLQLIPEDEMDFKKFREMEDDFYFEEFWSTDIQSDKKSLFILF